MKTRFIYIHGNSATHWSFAWAAWLKTELEKSGFETFFETMPDSVIARSEYWLLFLKDHVKAGENDVLIGWSSGAVAAMRYAETNKVKGSILVSPSYTDLGDDLEKQSGYFNTAWKWDDIKANQQQIALFYGDDDPFIPQEEFSFIAKQLKPTEIKIPAGKHFIERQEFAELLDYIKQTMLNLQNFLATHQPKNNRFFTIAIDGRGGSGKSTFTELLKSKLPGFVVLNGDDYFEPTNDPVVWGDFNDERFIQNVITPLKTGNSFSYRPYDWHTDPHITEQKIEITKGFCLERCFGFKFDLDWDLKIWVETPKEICLERGLARENMPPEKTIPAWKIWQQRENEYIRDFQPQEKADTVIDGTKPFEEQL